MKHPLLIVVSAPSGAGKSTLCDRVLSDEFDVIYSVSCTTRAPRGSELDGVDYNFLSTDDFESCVQAGDFLEYATVHGNSYGTLKETVRSAMEVGKSVMMDIDVQGACQVRDALKDLPDDDAMVVGFIDIFIEPPSMEELRDRLEGRGEDEQDVIEKRLKNAAEEMACAEAYKYRVINDNLDLACEQIINIIEEETLL